MIVSISQPAYLPWLGYFDRIAQSDVHVVLDHVPLERSSTTRFTNRNRIHGAAGPLWLTVPVVKTQGSQPLIDEAAIDNTQPWQARHRRSIEQTYARAPHAAALRPLLDTSYARPWTLLAPLLEMQRGWLLRQLGIATRVETSSRLGVAGSKGDLILELCRAVGAGTYLSGPFGRDYLDAAAFERAGIALRFHDYQHPRYPQQGTFQPFLSVIDLMAHCGPDSLRVLRASPAAP